ncbi:hypothetical protein HYC85_021775 [Camellia sinensis]|uniref:Uncharacterized protein n=1 Tax=Camellia sinensis TaxID=4442 RepID=A0A7J7GMJ7_CAMSI|nr:hypothetical protein HYC85_021775 [Camellia sinensis]
MQGREKSNWQTIICPSSYYPQGKGHPGGEENGTRHDDIFEKDAPQKHGVIHERRQDNHSRIAL